MLRGMRTFLLSFFGGFFGKLAAALFIAVCAFVGFGPDKWVGAIVGEPNLLVAIARTLALLAAVAMLGLWVWSSKQRALLSSYVPAVEAIKYISTQSRWWASRGYRPPWSLSLEAITEFNRCVRESGMSAKGRAQHSAAYKDIDPLEWRVIQLDYESILKPESKEARTEPRALIPIPPTNYDDVLVSMHIVHQLWPRVNFWQRLYGAVVSRYLEWKTQRPVLGVATFSAQENESVPDPAIVSDSEKRRAIDDIYPALEAAERVYDRGCDVIVGPWRDQIKKIGPRAFSTVIETYRAEVAGAISAVADLCDKHNRFEDIHKYRDMEFSFQKDVYEPMNRFREVLGKLPDSADDRLLDLIAADAKSLQPALATFGTWARASKDKFRRMRSTC